MVGWPRAQRYLDRGRGKLVEAAGQLWQRHHGPYERLAALTPLAANPSSPGEPTYLFSTQDLGIGPQVFAHGGYEEDDLRWVLDYLGHPQRDRTVLDVGANIGTTTIALLARYGAARVEAFEPDPFNFDVLRCNLILNHQEERAVVQAIAISDVDGEVELELCGYNFGDHRVRVNPPDQLEPGLHGEASRATVAVPARRLDGAVTASDDEIGLVWVDAQGHEAHILDGAERLLSRDIPWVIEYWPYGLRRQEGLDRLNEILAKRFPSVVDVRGSRRDDREVRWDTTELDVLADQLGTGYTDLILVPDPPT
jgi:FkbM family methyltransferase